MMYSRPMGEHTDGAAVHHISAVTGPKAFDKRDTLTEYELVYQAFVETGLLAEAEAAGRQALVAGEPVSQWAPRLAELALWRNQRDKAPSRTSRPSYARCISPGATIQKSKPG